ncbi:protoporphyrinogen oxidase [Actinokineospora xionganensis]|uniref:Coproporphyrinogen III oxidase n=1 Tax=Actinokineospora xionganensis TaxID=2684470 RepID=A0ABR7LAB0_9PSEU|nr:protoporphyrinogen oxidase [Actinokineospora xionganensis]MBC6449478.1 protoporphyrinogen oxidase [Actinokineospora xionganensis]
MRVAVIGGGIAGLTAAHRLRALLGPDAVITVIEQSDRLGGKLRTVDFAGIRYDVGAEAYLARRPEATALIRELGLEVTHPSGARSTVRAGGVTRMIPSGTMLGIPADPAAVTELLSDEGRDRVAAERTLAPIRLEGSDVGLGALLRSRYGDELPDRLIDPLLGGVYAGSIDNLGLRATMPQIAAALDAGATSLTAAARTVLTPASSAPSSGAALSSESSALGSEHRSGSVSGALGEERAPRSESSALDSERRSVSVSTSDGSGAVSTSGRGAAVFGTLTTGLGTLVDRLTRDVEVRLGVPVRELTKRPHGWRLVLGAAAPGHEPRESVIEVDAVVVAVPPPAARKLFERVVPVASVAYSRIEVASVGVVALALPTGTELPGTSGILVGAGERRSDGAPFAVKAFTYSATKWSHLDAVVVRGSVGRFGDPGALRADDEELVRLVRADLFDLTGVTAPPLDALVTRWGGGLPQYGVGHTALVARLEEAVAAHPGLAVAGAALHGVGIPACIGTGEAAARRVAAHLRTLTRE